MKDKDYSNWSNTRLIKHKKRLETKKSELETEIEKVNNLIWERVNELVKLIEDDPVKEPVSHVHSVSKGSRTTAPISGKNTREGVCGAETPSGKGCSRTDLLENGHCPLHQDEEEYSDEYTESDEDSE